MNKKVRMRLIIEFDTAFPKGCMFVFNNPDNFHWLQERLFDGGTSSIFYQEDEKLISYSCEEVK